MNSKLITFSVLLETMLIVFATSLEVKKTEMAIVPTPQSFFQESYRAHMQREAGSGMAEMRAQDARLYQICDRDHKCSPLSESENEKTAFSGTAILGKFCKFENAGSYTHICAW